MKSQQQMMRLVSQNLTTARLKRLFNNFKKNRSQCMMNFVKFQDI